MLYSKILLLALIIIPLSSMEKQKIIKKRKIDRATSVACDRCRKKHQGCENTVPCLRCIEAGEGDQCSKGFGLRKKPKKPNANTEAPKPNAYQSLIAEYSMDSSLKVETLHEPEIPPVQKNLYITDMINFEDLKNKKVKPSKGISTNRKKHRWTIYHLPDQEIISHGQLPSKVYSSETLTKMADDTNKALPTPEYPPSLLKPIETKPEDSHPKLNEDEFSFMATDMLSPNILDGQYDEFLDWVNDNWH